jgi:hypothetical protein
MLVCDPLGEGEVAQHSDDPRGKDSGCRSDELDNHHSSLHCQILDFHCHLAPPPSRLDRHSAPSLLSPLLVQEEELPFGLGIFGGLIRETPQR